MSKLANAKRDLRAQVNTFEKQVQDEIWNKVMGTIACNFHGKMSQKQYAIGFHAVRKAIYSIK